VIGGALVPVLLVATPALAKLDEWVAATQR